jgi:chromosome partitioning protein
MKTVTVASAKGGTGKSTITALLAVRASQDTPRVAMMDLNFDQGSLTQWWGMRGEPDSPKLIDEDDIEKIPRDVKKLAAAYDWLFIDTPPLDMDVIEQAIAVADAVVIPVKAGFFDIMASQSVVEMCQERRKPFSLLLNAMDVKFKVLMRQAKVAFVDIGPLFATQIDHRLPYIQALSKGKTGAEIDKSAREEVDGLWAEIKRLAEKGRQQ